jgi:hypothetical protein
MMEAGNVVRLWMYFEGRVAGRIGAGCKKEHQNDSRTLGLSNWKNGIMRN